jgi:3D (Asp-Asp-Asp) domain-containing protein
MKPLILASILVFSIITLTGFAFSEREVEPVSFNTFYHEDALFVEQFSTPSTPTGEIVVIEDDTKTYKVENKKESTEPKGRWVWAKVTAYTPWDAIDKHSGYQDGYTSTMKDTRKNPYGIAADPRVIPYGTKVYVPNYFESLLRNKSSRPTTMTIVDDTGGAMRRSWRNGIIHIDVRYRTSRAAKKWGTRWMYIFIFDN